MFALGFEGACISPWSLRDWAGQSAWSPTFGLGMAELVEGGFPVIPRFRLSQDCEANIVISAFLGRPLIPVGHHDTVAGGLDLLARIAELINSLGEVRWGSPEMILRSNFLSRIEGATLAVRPCAARLCLTVPPEVTALRIEPSETGAFRVAARGTAGARVIGPEPIPVRAGEELEVVAEGWGTIDCAQVERPGFSWWATPRRVLCETRDRLQPVLPRVRRRRSPVASP
jgi:hypothetical protein